mgnify:FL=1
MLFKILFLMAALKLHDVKTEPFSPTLLYCLPIFLISLFSDIPFIALFIGTVIMLCVTYVYFGLLTKFNHGIEYFAIMGVGGAILLMFI